MVVTMRRWVLATPAPQSVDVSARAAPAAAETPPPLTPPPTLPAMTTSPGTRGNVVWSVLVMVYRSCRRGTRLAVKVSEQLATG